MPEGATEWILLTSRLIALACFLVLLIPVCIRISRSDSPDAWKARIATIALFGDVAATQLYAVLTRLFEYAPPEGPVVLALLALVVSLLCLWGFWPFARPTERD